MGNPIAINGMSCRFPGAPSCEAFWQVLIEGRDTTSRIPSDRLAEHRLESLSVTDRDFVKSMRGGFIDDVRGFDAAFFHISPREAEALDPQQRLLLEVAWEAIEDAGLRRAELEGSRTGVYVALATADYGGLQHRDPQTITAHTNTGCAPSIAAGRIAYWLDLRGPALAIDTACSSSLVAIHLACQALRTGEIDRAIVASANLILSENVSLGFQRLNALSPEGRCRTFDASADGYARGEGAGAVVLQLLARAHASAGRVRCVIRGTAVNQDGRSNGLTAPSRTAQERVVRDACEAAEVAPHDVDYVEAHGTGTPLGDPIEAHAIGAVMGSGRRSGPCSIGSVKSNFGHLEAVAGMAGLIKLALAIEHGMLPPSIHFEHPNPRIPFAALGIRTQDTLTPWPRDELRLGGVSSFGFGGTNAHAILGPAGVPAQAPRTRPALGGRWPIPLSAHSLEALGELRANLASLIERGAGQVDLHSLSFSLACRRTRHAWSTCTWVSGVDELRAALAVPASGAALAEVLAAARRPRVAWWIADIASAGAQSFEFAGRSPSFQTNLRRLCQGMRRIEPGALDCVLDASSSGVLGEALSRLDGVERSLVSFLVDLAYIQLFRALCVDAPAVIVGEGLGEIAAACACGLISESDAVDFAYAVVTGELPRHDIEQLPSKGSPAWSSSLAGPLAGANTALWLASLLQRAEANSLRTGAPSFDLLLTFGEESRGRQAFAGAAPTLAAQANHPPAAAFEAAVGALFCRGVALDWRPLLGEGAPYLSLPNYPWQRQPYWLRRESETKVAPAERAGETSLRAHPLLGVEVTAVDPTGARSWETSWSAMRTGWLGDHRVQGALIAPLVSYAEVGLAVAVALFGEAESELSDLSVRSPLFLPDDGEVAVRVVAFPSRSERGEDGARFEIFSRRSPPAGASTGPAARRDWTSNATGFVLRRPVTRAFGPETVLAIDAHAHDGESIAGESHYELLRRAGFQHGPTFRGIERVWIVDDTIMVAQARVPEACLAELQDYQSFPPAAEYGGQLLLRHVAELSLSAGRGDTGALFLPVHIASLHYRRRHGERLWVRSRVLSADTQELVGDVDIHDASGDLVMAARGVHFRRAGVDVAVAPPTQYRLAWQEAELIRSVEPKPGVLALHAGNCEQTSALTREAVKRGWSVVHVPAEDDAEGARALTALRAAGQPVRWLAIPTLTGDAVADVCRAWSGLRALLEDRSPLDALATFVTVGAPLPGLPCGEGTAASSAGALWGMVRAVRHEHPALAAQLVDLDPSEAPSSWAMHLLDELEASTDAEVAFRGQLRLAPRLAARGSVPGEVSFEVESYATYVVTGGLGAIGLRVAAWLAERGARRIVLATRSELPARASWTELFDAEGKSEVRRRIQGVLEIERHGTNVTVVSLDVSDEAQVVAFVRAHRAEQRPPIRAIFHAAGVLGDAPISVSSVDDIRRVLEVKIGAAQAFRSALAGEACLEVYFSSVVALFGNEGQSAYAAANAFLDAEACARAARDEQVVSLGWGPWTGGGMAEGPLLLARAARAGVRATPPEEAIASLERVLREGARGYVLLAPLDIERLRVSEVPAVRNLVRAEVSEAEAPERASELDALLSLDSEKRLDCIVDALVRAAASGLQLAPEEIALDVSLLDLGLDSLSGLDIETHLNAALGVSPKLVDMMRGPSIRQLATDLCEQLDRVSSTGVPRRPLRPLSDRRAPVALSFAQTRMWFLDRLVGGVAAAYNVACAVTLRGSWDTARLQASLNAIAERHEVLRTQFIELDGEPQQVVGPDLLVPFRVEQIPDLPPDPDARARALNAQIAAIGAEPFSLAEGMLLRGVLLEASSNEAVLVVVAHHIACDGYSTSILFRELVEHYRQEERAQSQPLPVQVRDHAVWQRNLLEASSALVKEARAYWSGALRSAPPKVEVVTDHPAPRTRSYRGERLSFPLEQGSVQLNQPVRERALALKTTPFVVFLAILDGTLHRWTGQTDLVVGTVISLREHVSVQDLVGDFTNFLPLRVLVDDACSGEELVRRAKHTVDQAFRFQALPFEQIVEAVNPQRKVGENPLYNVAFLMHTYRIPTAATLSPGLEAIPRLVENGTAELDLTFEILETPEGFALEIEYATDLFARSTIESMASAFRNAAAAFVTDPMQSVGAWQLVTAEERERIDVCLSGPSVARPATTTGAWLEAQAVRTPEAVALQFGDQRVSYAHFNAAANRAARELIARGVQPGDHVGVCMHRSPELAVALAAAWKAGAAYVPIDADSPAERARGMALQAGVKVLFVAPETAKLEALRDREVVTLSGMDAFPGNSGDDLGIPRAPEDAAYVLFTSGSTGKPKGAVIPHRGLLNRLLWMQEAYALTVRDAVLQKTPVTFDVSVWEFFWPLMFGARLVLAKPSGHRDVDYLLGVIERAAITTIHFVPSMLRAFLEPAWDSARLRSLRTVVCSGETLSPALQNALLTRLPWCQVHNLYGPTEASIDVTAWRCRLDSSGGTVPIGRPIANTWLSILDSHGNVVPLGAPGELFIGGHGVGLGYVGQPDLTAERFVPDPVVAARVKPAGGRLYRTGDRVRIRSDGEIEYLGRLDTQVKVRGVRIELSEVEAHLLAMPGVAYAVAHVVEQPGSGAVLSGYVVRRDDASGRSLSTSSIRAFLAQRLPDAFVPSRMTFLDVLPLSSSGKVDRQALPGAQDALSESEAGPPPISDWEKRLALIFQSVLDVPVQTVTQNFFDLGGHSLSAMLLATRIQASFGRAVSVADVFQRPTVAALVDLLERVPSSLGTARPSPTDLQRVSGPDAVGSFSASFAQQQMWLFEQIQADTAANHLVAVVQLEGRLEQTRLNDALQGLVQRQASLRTGFVMTAEGLRQTVVAFAALRATVVRVPGATDDERARHLLRMTRELLHTPFDLARPPLVRATLFELGVERAVLAIVMHHIVSDRWSVGVLVRDLSALYANRPEALPKLAVHYPDFALSQHTEVAQAAQREALRFWRERLASAPTLLDLRTDFPRPAQWSGRGGERKCEIPASAARRIRELARVNDATLYAVLLTGFNILLHRISGQRDLLVGMPVANRNHLGTEDLIGYFVNPVVVRSRISRLDMRFSELLHSVQKELISCLGHSEVPFELLVRELRPVRSLAHNPIFQVMCVLQNAPLPPVVLDGVVVQRTDVTREHVQFDLMLVAEELEDGGLALTLEYASDLFLPATAERLLTQLVDIIIDASRERTACVRAQETLAEATGLGSAPSLTRAGMEP